MPQTLCTSGFEACHVNRLIDFCARLKMKEQYIEQYATGTDEWHHKERTGTRYLLQNFRKLKSYSSVCFLTNPRGITHTNGIHLMNKQGAP